MLTDQQIKLRQTGLGGSDVAAVLGLSPWKTPLELWSEKTGRNIQLEESSAMEWGNRLESPILQKYRDSHHDVHVTPGSGTIRHSEHSCLLATPDAFIVDKGRSPGILEIKTSSAAPWAEVPAHYKLQLEHYLYVLGRPVGYFAVLFRGREYVEYGPFYSDRDVYEEEVLPHLLHFWQCVKDDNPELVPQKLHDLIIKGIEPDDDEPPVELSLSSLLLANNYRNITREIKAFKAEQEKIKLTLAQSLGDAKKGVNESGRLIVSQYLRTSPPRFDMTRFKQDHPELHAEYLKGEGKPSLVMRFASDES